MVMCWIGCIKMMNDYNYIDLFHGIGGFALGVYWAGMKFKNHFCSDIEPYTQELYKLRFPDSIQLGDITKIDTKELLQYGDKWIITGGFPCQDISIAGKGEGITGARSGLWFEYWRIIRDLRPRYAIMENVSAITFRGLDAVLGSLAEIGYNAEWQNIRASDVGAPHRRERIWIVAYPRLQRPQEHEEQTAGIEQCGEAGNVAYTGCELWKPWNATGMETDTGKRTHSELHDKSGREGQTSCELSHRGRKAGKRRREFANGGEISDPSITRLQGKESKSRTREYNRLFTERYTGNWITEPAVGRLAHGVPTVLDGNLRRLYNANVNDSEAISKIDNYYKSILFGMWIKKNTTTSSCGGKSGFSYSLVSKMPYEITHDEWYMGKWIEKDEVLCNMWKDVLSREENIQDLLTEMSVRIRENQRNEKMASKRVDRLKGLGNAIVPQIAEILFNQIKSEFF